MSEPSDYLLNRVHPKPPAPEKIKSTKVEYVVASINGVEQKFYDVLQINQDLGDMVPMFGGYVRTPANLPTLMLENGTEIAVDFGMIRCYLADGTVKEIDATEPEPDTTIHYPPGRDPKPWTPIDKRWWYSETLDNSDDDGTEEFDESEPE